ncbi:MAG: hypothetical protein MI754_07745 [Chromatiales bacterium]|nr:hypothetical protein [Chromatiales bacterium]
MIRKMSLVWLVLALWFAGIANVVADEVRYRPFTLASTSPGSVSDKLAGVRASLQQNGFEIAGEYAPYPGAHILIVTNAEMRKSAAGSDHGGFGAAARVALTESNGQVQVSYTSPGWMTNVYRMNGDGEAVARKLAAALGSAKGFGSEGGRKVANLREYHYMMFMPYFDDQVTLAEYAGYKEALAAVNKALSTGQGGSSKVYQIDIPGKEETLIGVALKQGEGADATVMATTDQGELKHTAHLPYEILVSGSKVYMLHGKFRIAQSFPDLTMGTFMKISGAPDAIEASLRAAAGN